MTARMVLLGRQTEDDEAAALEGVARAVASTTTARFSLDGVNGLRPGMAKRRRPDTARNE